MGARVARADFAQRYARMEERARLERVRRKGHTETKTFVISGPVDVTTYIPPFFVGIDWDGSTPEWKTLNCYRGLIRTLTDVDNPIYLDWRVSGVTVCTDHIVTLNPNEFERTQPDIGGDVLKVSDGDYIQPIIQSGEGSDLSVAVVFTTAAR